MYERIIGTGNFVELNPNTVIAKKVETFRVYSEDMREVLITVPGFDAAKKYLEDDVRRMKLACGTGSCED